MPTCTFKYCIIMLYILSNDLYILMKECDSWFRIGLLYKTQHTEKYIIIYIRDT